MLNLATSDDQPLWSSPEFNVEEVETSREAVRQWFSLPTVRFIGAHTGCSCGFPYIVAEEPGNIGTVCLTPATNATPISKLAGTPHHRPGARYWVRRSRVVSGLGWQRALAAERDNRSVRRLAGSRDLPLHRAVLLSRGPRAGFGSRRTRDWDRQVTRPQIGVAVLIVGVISAILWNPIVDRFLHRETYRGEVRTLYDNVQPGMTKEQVRQVMDSVNYPHLGFHSEGQLWLGSAPLEFGAGNWVLAIEFQDDQVSAVRVRKGDGLQEFHHPVEAPLDKVRSMGGSD